MLQCTSVSPDGQTKGLATAFMPIWAGCGDRRVVQSSPRVPSRDSEGVIARPRTSYWPVGMRRIKASVGDIDAIMTVCVYVYMHENIR